MHVYKHIIATVVISLMKMLFDFREVVESHLMSSLKESDAMKHKNHIMSLMQERDHNQLWLGLLHGNINI